MMWRQFVLLKGIFQGKGKDNLRLMVVVLDE